MLIANFEKTFFLRDLICDPRVLISNYSSRISARNQLYEHTTRGLTRADSDIYEKPFKCIKVHKNEFYSSVDPTKNFAKLMSQPKAKSSPTANPPGKFLANPRSAKRPLTPPRDKFPKVMLPHKDDVYDQPLGFISSLPRKHGDETSRDKIPLRQLKHPRVHSTYEKTLPDSPPVSGIYDYATRDDVCLKSTRFDAEKPLEIQEGESVNSNGRSSNETPHYDVLYHR